MPTFLPLRSLMVRMGSCANSSKHPGCTPASTVSGYAGIHRDQRRPRAQFMTEIDLAAAIRVA